MHGSYALPFFLNLLYLLGVACLSFVVQLVRQRYHLNSSTAPSSFENISQCEKGDIESATLLPAQRESRGHHVEDRDDVPHESDRLEMVGIHPHAVAQLQSPRETKRGLLTNSHLPSADFEESHTPLSVEVLDCDDAITFTPSLPNFIGVASASDTSVTTSIGKTKRSVGIQIVSYTLGAGEDDDDDEDAHMHEAGTLVNSGSMQVKGMGIQDVRGEWEEAERGLVLER
ncbi:hypothetical protein IQ06DRAFT_293061 [Phaeosphaeriaceae sp. SRC1lsM3a]|nr:hypothetical protein IQ06DRAFT_293061 [Stagonospora sp. SRC1lsM3a]